MTEKIFADGIKIKSYQTKYGEILKFGIKSDDFMEFLAKHTNDRGYCNIDVLKGKSGNWYGELNQYKKDSQNEISDDTVMNFDELDEVPF